MGTIAVSSSEWSHDLRLDKGRAPPSLSLQVLKERKKILQISRISKNRSRDHTKYTNIRNWNRPESSKSGIEDIETYWNHPRLHWERFEFSPCPSLLLRIHMFRIRTCQTMFYMLFMRNGPELFSSFQLWGPSKDSKSSAASTAFREGAQTSCPRRRRTKWSVDSFWML